MIDELRAKQIIDLFLEFVAKQQNGEKADFKSGYLLIHEGYKDGVYVRANDILLTETWNQKMIKSGEIARRMAKALYVKGNNFIAWQNKDDFKKMLEERPAEGSQVLFNLFCGRDDSAALEGLVSFTGSRWYDLISTLFYMKKPSKYYPCKPRYFRRAFSELGMASACFESCTYENYTKFNEGIREITEFFSKYAGHIDVLDGHSFAWVIGAYEDARAYIFEGTEESSDVSSDAGDKAEDGKPRQEGQSTVKTRLKQSEYRRNLLDYWDGKCAVTGCGLTDVLIASHIKPWSKCETHQESVSKYNGFLLTPNLDRLFDYGFISFTDAGRILISKDVPESEYGVLGLATDMRVRKIEEGHNEYLVYHRKNVFRG